MCPRSVASGVAALRFDGDHQPFLVCRDVAFVFSIPEGATPLAVGDCSDSVGGPDKLQDELSTGGSDERVVSATYSFFSRHSSDVSGAFLYMVKDVADEVGRIAPGSQYSVHVSATSVLSAN